MRPDTELRLLADTIIDFYELRVLVVEMILLKSNSLLKAFREELEHLIGMVRLNLAKSENLRCKDFDFMIRDFIQITRENETEAEKGLMAFHDEEREMIRLLRNITRNNIHAPVETLQAVREDILVRQKEREQRIINILQRHHVHYEEFKEGLQKLVNKGEQVRLKDFRRMLRVVKTRNHHEYNELFSLLTQFDMIRSSVFSQWEIPSQIKFEHSNKPKKTTEV